MQKANPEELSYVLDYIGSLSKARTWDRRINRLPQSFGFSDTYVKIRSAITANFPSARR
jgi:hypothetical protein